MQIKYSDKLFNTSDMCEVGFVYKIYDVRADCMASVCLEECKQNTLMLVKVTIACEIISILEEWMGEFKDNEYISQRFYLFELSYML